MLDDPSQHATRLLQALGVSNGMLHELARQLRQRGEVVGVQVGYECKKYPLNPNPIVEAYVDVDLGNGRGATWVLDATWDEEIWRIDYSVLAAEPEGQRSVLDFPPKTAETLDDFVRDLLAATSELVEAARGTDLSTWCS